MIARRLRARWAGPLAADTTGAAAIEFALVAPVFMLLLLGLGDLGHMVYVKSVLNGAVEDAARSGSLETADTTAIDNAVKARIAPVVPNATVSTTRRSYFDFADINRAEKWTDSNNNGTCDNGENYIDENKSGSWEANVGRASNGSAGDVVLYTVTVSYQPVFTAKFMSNWGSTRSLSATAVRKNQPFADQSSYGSSAGTCR